MTQKEAVLEYFKTNKTLTQLQAIDLFGATRLSDIVYKLKKDGYRITTGSRETINRYGRKVTYGVYTYKGRWDEQQG